MTAEVQKIKDWISKEQDGLMDTQGNFEYPEHEGAYHILCNLDSYIDSLQEEPVSEELEKAAEKSSYCEYLEEVLSNDDKEVLKSRLRNNFKTGVQWQKRKMMKDAIDATITGIRIYKEENEVDFTVMLEKGIVSYELEQEVKIIVIKDE